MGEGRGRGGGFCISRNNKCYLKSMNKDIARVKSEVENVLMCKC